MSVGESLAEPNGESFQFQPETIVIDFGRQLLRQQFAGNNLRHRRQPPTLVSTLPRQIMMVKQI